uniref:PITH domain-containing protein n=1 Tax=Heterorhabditis bacteriophora TaxID=37862 RepID=A0A1I7WRQ5_HETBA
MVMQFELRSGVKTAAACDSSTYLRLFRSMHAEIVRVPQAPSDADADNNKDGVTLNGAGGCDLLKCEMERPNISQLSKDVIMFALNTKKRSHLEP